MWNTGMVRIAPLNQHPRNYAVVDVKISDGLHVKIFEVALHPSAGAGLSARKYIDVMAF
jgi:hypothetical protein